MLLPPDLWIFVEKDRPLDASSNPPELVDGTPRSPATSLQGFFAIGQRLLAVAHLGGFLGPEGDSEGDS